MVRQKFGYFAREDGQINIPRGRVFGGSSVLNSMNYYRESPEYFDLWKTLYGVNNWSYDDVMPFFLKSENNLDEQLVANSNGYHVSGGLLHLTTADLDIMLKRYIKAAKLMGYLETYTDGRDPYGIAVMQRTIRDGVRQSASLAFIEKSINSKPNLHTVGFSRVTKILFDENNRAIGVIFHRNGTFHKVIARKEVIVSAGTIGSPQLLMLSGIGPEQHLRSLNIPVISNLRVGDNLQSSIGFELQYDIKNQSEIQKPILNMDNSYKYFIEHRGSLTYKASGVICFKEIPLENFPRLSNGCILPRLAFQSNHLESLVDKLKLKNEWEDYYRPYLGRAYFELIVLVRRPRSTGTIRLASNNPLDNPLIDPCVYCDETDIDDLVDTTKLALKIYESEYFKQFAQIYQNSIPGCDPCSDDYFCDSYIRCIAQTATFYLTPVGGCSIGAVDDDKSIVDERLRVKGVTRLRVIDSSILPLVSEQTQGITIMIGERGAQLVKEDHCIQS